MNVTENDVFGQWVEDTLVETDAPVIVRSGRRGAKDFLDYLKEGNYTTSFDSEEEARKPFQRVVKALVQLVKLTETVMEESKGDYNKFETLMNIRVPHLTQELSSAPTAVQYLLIQLAADGVAGHLRAVIQNFQREAKFKTLFAGLQEALVAGQEEVAVPDNN